MDTKFGTNVSSRMLLNAANCQGHSLFGCDNSYCIFVQHFLTFLIHQDSIAIHHTPDSFEYSEKQLKKEEICSVRLVLEWMYCLLFSKNWWRYPSAGKVIKFLLKGGCEKIASDLEIPISIVNFVG